VENEMSTKNDDDLNEQDIRRRLLDRTISEPAGDNDGPPSYVRSRSYPSKSDSVDESQDFIGTVLEVPTKCVEQAKEVGKRVVKYVVDHSHLPHWLLDNEYLVSGHRPPMPSFKQCFASIFRLHTETVNIWTHLLGTLFFVIIAIYFISRPSSEVHIEQKLIFGAFFLGAIICLLFSTLYHTVYCHSPKISKFFNKLDYCGISILIISSFIPWIYYGFYCEFGTKIAYLLITISLGTGCIIVSMWDKFSTPEYRTYRALLFIAFGLFGFVPTIHYVLLFGFKYAFTTGAAQWLVVMAVLYITGACLYAARIPERLAPGYFDIWFQSHQIFHVFVVAAACVHYYGLCVLSLHQSGVSDCRKSVIPSIGTVFNSMSH
jgi:adiponectin receptor